MLFGLTTAMRPLGAQLAGACRFRALAGGRSLLAAGGLLALGGKRVTVARRRRGRRMGVGFALPYAVMVDAAQALFPGRATATLALVQTGPLRADGRHPNRRHGTR